MLVCADDNNVVSTSDVKDKDKLKEIIDKVKETVDKNKKIVKDVKDKEKGIVKGKFQFVMNFRVITISLDRFPACTRSHILKPWGKIMVTVLLFSTPEFIILLK